MKPNTKRVSAGIKNVPVFHLELVRDRSVAYRKAHRTEDIAQVMHEILDSSPVEQFVVVYLDMKGEVIGAEKVAVGGLDRVQVALKDMFRGAICACVNTIAIGHNHPHGECKPSYEDIILTSVAINVADLLGIKLMDHIIVSPDGSHYSVWDHQDECISAVHARQAQEKLERMLIQSNPIAALVQMFGEKKR